MKKKKIDDNENYEYEEDNENYDENYDDEEYDDAEEDDEPEVKEARPENTLKLIFAVVIIALVVVGILLTVFFVFKNKNKDPNPEATIESGDAIVEEDETHAENSNSSFVPGSYKVKIPQGYTLNLRDAPSSDGNVIVEDVVNGQVLEISEVQTDKNDKNTVWGKTVYQGKTLWVNVLYLDKNYGGEETTRIEEKTTVEDKTTEAEKTTVEEQTEEETTVKESGSHKGPTTAGSYTVDVAGVTDALNMRSSHDVSTELVVRIPDGEKLDITEVYHDKDTDNDTMMYWGKTTYQGQTGWVAMGYLK